MKNITLKLINILLTLSWRRPLSYRNQSIDCLANQWTGFYMITASVMKGLNTNLLFAGVKFSLMNKFALGIPTAFLSMDLNFFLFRRAFKQCFLLITRTITFFVFFPRRWQASISFVVTLTSIAFNMSTTFSSSWLLLTHYAGPHYYFGFSNQ